MVLLSSDQPRHISVGPLQESGAVPLPHRNMVEGNRVYLAKGHTLEIIVDVFRAGLITSKS